MRVMAFALCGLIGLATGAEAWDPWGAWCDETGREVIALSEFAVALHPQTACLLDTPYPADGVFAGQLQCEVSLALQGEGWQHFATAVTLETRPMDEGRLGVRLGDGEVTGLLPCEAVWPL